MLNHDHRRRPRAARVRLASALTAVLVLLACAAPAAARQEPEPRLLGEPLVAPPAEATGGMVSSAHPLATQAGLDVLAAGGTAFDAAVAVAAALGVVEPAMSGIGGYGTILVHDAATNTTRFLNASGRIPRGVEPAAFRAPTPGWQEHRRGARAVSTPGNVDAWETLWRAYGTRPWASLFDAAIAYANDGFALGEHGARHIAAAFDEFPPHAREIYGCAGVPLLAGDTLVQRDLGATLYAIALHGAGVVSRGTVAEAIDRAMREAGGFLTLADLYWHESEWWTPIGIDYRGHRVVTASPPANAFDALVRIGIMGWFDLEGLGHNTVDYLHTFAEATKHAYSLRLRHAADPSFGAPPLERLLSARYWTEQALRIDPRRATRWAPPAPDAGRDDDDDGGGDDGAHTTHFVVADRFGNVVSATQTLGNAFGARIMPAGTGVWLNNSLAYSTFEPAGNPMDAHPGRRKLSGDVPVIILRGGRPWAALGTPGGHTIGQTAAQLVINLIDFEMDVAHALAAPRVAFLEPDRLAVEPGIAETTRAALAARGHHVVGVPALGNAHALTIEYDAAGRAVRFTGAADPRGEGVARGIGW